MQQVMDRLQVIEDPDNRYGHDAHCKGCRRRHRDKGAKEEKQGFNRINRHRVNELCRILEKHVIPE